MATQFLPVMARQAPPSVVSRGSVMVCEGGRGVWGALYLC